MNMDFIEKTHTEVKDYIEGMKLHEAAIAEIRANYAGDTLAAKLAEQEANAPNAEAAMSILDGYRASAQAEFDALTDKSLDSGAITQDYKLLQLPVTLSPEEVEKLHKRNITDPLFTRALQDYCRKNKVSATVYDAITPRRRELDSFFDIHKNIVRRNDSDTLYNCETFDNYKMLRDTLSFSEAEAQNE